MKNNKIRFLSTTLSILVAGAAMLTLYAVPTHAETQNKGISNMFSQIQSKIQAISSNPSSTDITNAVNNLLNSDKTQQGIDKAQQFVDKIQSNDKIKSQLQASINKAKEDLSNKTLIDEATKKANALLQNPNKLSSDVTKLTIDKAQQLVNKIPSNAQNQSLINKLQSNINKANTLLANK